VVTPNNSICRFIVINKLDRDNANFAAAYARPRNSRSGEHRLVVQLPVGEKHEFKGRGPDLDEGVHGVMERRRARSPGDDGGSQRGSGSTSGGGR
jgi:hypothetical protein